MKYDEITCSALWKEEGGALLLRHETRSGEVQGYNSPEGRNTQGGEGRTGKPLKTKMMT